MSLRRTRLVALVAVASVATAVASTQTSATATTEPPAPAAPPAAPVGPGCAGLPTEGEGSAAGMSDDRAATAAANNPELSTLVSAVDAAGLTAALDGEGPFTIFAPVNAAFEKIPQNVLDSILADADLLNSILLYHVVSGQALDATALVTAGQAETAGGDVLTVAQDGDAVTINGGEATVVCANVQVANGVVHLIDSVLQPPSEGAGADGSTSVASSGPDVTAVVTPADGPQGPLCASLPPDGEGSIAGMSDDPAATAAANNPELSTLVSAVTAAGLVDTLNGEGPFTIFAPSNSAFAALPEADLAAILQDTDLLTSILTYHVIAGESLSAADLATAGTVATVNGGELTFTVEPDGTLSINGGAATVGCSNIPVANGTVHVIDQVLVPPAA